MYRTALSSQARRQLLWTAILIAIAALVTMPFLWTGGAVGIFVWSCLVLAGVIVLGQREDHLHHLQDDQR